MLLVLTLAIVHFVAFIVFPEVNLSRSQNVLHRNIVVVMFLKLSLRFLNINDLCSEWLTYLIVNWITVTLSNMYWILDINLTCLILSSINNSNCLLNSMYELKMAKTAMNFIWKTNIIFSPLRISWLQSVREPIENTWANWTFNMPNCWYAFKSRNNTLITLLNPNNGS